MRFIASIIEKTVLFPFTLLEEFLTVLFFPKRDLGSAWGRKPTRREQAQRQTIKRLTHRVKAERSARQHDAVYWHRLLRDQDRQHRKEKDDLEKRYRDRQKRSGSEK
jgi:hypothetical protein